MRDTIGGRPRDPVSSNAQAESLSNCTKTLTNAAWLRTLEWLLFTVGVSCTPLIADVTIRAMRGSLSWAEYLSEGQLFLVVAVLCGTALGRLVCGTTPVRALRLSTGFACTVLLFLAGYYYVALCGAQAPLPGVPPNAIVALTWVITLLAVLCTSIALYITEGAK